MRRLVVVAALLFFANGCGGSVADGPQRDAGVAPGPADASPGVPPLDAVAEAGPDIDAAGCVLAASNYNQSCTVDTDCVPISTGNYCDPLTCMCGGVGDVISKNALPQFQADVAKTPIGSGAIQGASCGCPLFGLGACCVAGMCQFGFDACSGAGDALAACADAGGTCSRFVEECGGRGAGPANSCAYADETCCLN